MTIQSRICKANHLDIEEINFLYEMVSIQSKENLTVREILGSFNTNGGIFYIPKNELISWVEEDKFVFLVAKSQNSNNLVGSYAVQKQLPIDFKVKFYQDIVNKEWIHSFTRAFKARKVALSLDTVVHPDFRRQGVATQLKLAMFEALKSQDYSYLLIEIYTVLFIEYSRDNFSMQPINMQNVPSVELHKKLNASLIGEVERPIQNIGDYQFHVKSNLYSINLQHACLPSESNHSEQKILKTC